MLGPVFRNLDETFGYIIVLQIFICILRPQGAEEERKIEYTGSLLK